MSYAMIMNKENKSKAITGKSWYVKDEVVLTLEDIDTSNIDVVFHTRKSLSANGSLSKAKAALLNDSAIKMGLITTALSFPVISKKAPVGAVWEKLEPAREGLLRLPKGDYVIKWQDGAIVQADMSADQACHYSKEEFSALLADIATDALKSHLCAGYNAFIFAKGAVVKWISVPNYHLTEEWAVVSDEFDSKIEDFVILKERIKKSKEFTAALDQSYRLKKLPFAWFVGTKVAGKGVIAWRGLDKKISTVKHLVVDEHFKEGRLSRNPNDFYCTGKMSEDNRMTTDYNYSIMVDGVVVKKLPHLITCKTCNDRIDKLLEIMEKGE